MDFQNKYLILILQKVRNKNQKKLVNQKSMSFSINNET